MNMIPRRTRHRLLPDHHGNDHDHGRHSAPEVHHNQQLGDEEGGMKAHDLPKTKGHVTSTPMSTATEKLLGQKLNLMMAAVMMMMMMIYFSYEYAMLLHYRYIDNPVQDPCLVASRELEKISALETTSTATKDNIYTNIMETIPKIIHQQWKTNLIPYGGMTTWHDKWKQLFPPSERYSHMLWTDESARRLIEAHYPWFLPTYDGYDVPIKRADAARYFILHRHGGLYADLDYEPITNFWHRFPTDRVSVVESPYGFNEQVQNSLMVSPRGHELWEIVFEVLEERREMGSILDCTGPKMLDEAVSRAPRGYQYVLPCENFQRIPLGRAGEGNTLLARFSREFTARFSRNAKQCGDANDNRCQFALHHNFISYYGGIKLKERVKGDDRETMIR